MESNSHTEMSAAKKKLKRVKQLIDEAKAGKIEFQALIGRINAAISCQCREPEIIKDYCHKCKSHIYKMN